MKKFARILCFVLLATLLCTVLASCGPAKDPADAVAALEEAQYTVKKVDKKVDFSSYEKQGLTNLTCVIEATKISEDKRTRDSIVIYYFADKDSAETGFARLQKIFEEDTQKDAKEQSKYTLKQSGTMVYKGTEAAIKAAR